MDTFAEVDWDLFSFALSSLSVVAQAMRNKGISVAVIFMVRTLQVRRWRAKSPTLGPAALFLVRWQAFLRDCFRSEFTQCARDEVAVLG